MKTRSMMMCVSVLAAVAAGCCAFQFGAAREKTIPLPKAVAFTPVGGATGAKAVTGRPVMDGNVIRCLNKELSFNEQTGTFRVSADGLTILQSEMPQCGHLHGRDELIWLSPTEYNHKKQWKADVTRTGNRIACSYTLTIEGVSYLQSKAAVELLPDGLIRFEKEAFPSPKPETITLDCEIYLLFCKAAAPGTHYAVKDNPALVPSEAYEAQCTYISIEKDGGYAFDYCPNDPVRRFSVRGEKSAPKDRFVLEHYDGRGDELRGRYHGRKTVLYIDLRTGVEKVVSPDLRAGVDFRKIEDLEMPDDTRRNLLPNGSFACGFRNWSVLYNHDGTHVYDPKKWDREVFRLIEVGAFEGRQALSVHAQAPLGNNDVRCLGGMYPNLASTPLYLAKGTYTLSYAARGTKPGTRLGVWFPRFRYGSTYLPKDGKPGTDGKFVKTVDPTTEWQRYTLTFDLPADDVVWAEFTFRAKDDDSRIELDAVQLERGPTAHAYEPAVAESRLLTSDPGNFCDAAKPLGAKLAIASAQPNAKGTVRVEARTFLDETVFDRTYDFTTDANRQGLLDLAVLDTELPPRGLFALKRTWTVGGETTFEYDRLERVEFCTGKEKWKFLSNDYNWNGLRYDMRRYYDRYHKLGMNQAYHTAIEPLALREEYERRGISNDAATMVNGFFDEEVPDPARPGKTRLRRLGWGVGHKHQNVSYAACITNDTAHVKCYILNHKAYGLEEPDAAYLARFRDACAAKARDYPHIRLWEFANEFFAGYDASWWNKECDKDKALRTYAKYLKAYYEGVKSANPAAEVHADAPCNMGEDGIGQLRVWAKILADQGVRMDGISFHTYRHAPENPDFDADMTEVFSILKANGYPETTQLYFGEGMHWGAYEVPSWGLISDSWGGAPRTWQGGSAFSYDIGQTERRAAAWRARSWLVDFKYAPRISQACAGNKNGFAIDIALTPVLNQMVANTLLRLLGDADFVADVRFAPYTRAFVFRDAQDRPVVAVWNHKEDVDYGRIAPPVAAADFGANLEGVYDMMYTPREVPVGRFEFPLLSAPLFFRGKPGTLEAVLAAVRKAHVVNGSFADMYSVAANPATPEKTGVALKDNVTGTVSNYFVATRTPLRADRPTRVRLRKEGAVYDGLLAKSAPVGSTLETLDWKRYPQVVLGNVFGIPGKGFGARYRVAWNATGLFLEVEVKDRTFCHVLTKRPFDRWANDSVQIYVDAGANARANTTKCYDTDDYEYSLFPEPDGSRCRVFRVRQCDWQLGLGTSAPPDLTYADDIPTSFEKTADGYRYRVCFPSKYLLPLKLEKGSVVGLGLAANDANDPTAPQDKRRVGGFSNTTQHRQDCYNKPYLYPAVLLWD